jgi:uncharacterized protein YndB with AHSA1/START domain
MKPKIVLEATYPHPPERVWRALTDNDALAAWLLPVAPAGAFAPRLGHRFAFEAPDPGEGGNGRRKRIGGEVTGVEEGRRLAYTWQADPDAPPTLVTWTLEPVDGGNGTRVRLEHDPAAGPFAAATNTLALGRVGAALRGPCALRRGRASFRARPPRRRRVSASPPRFTVGEMIFALQGERS